MSKRILSLLALLVTFTGCGGITGLDERPAYVPLEGEINSVTVQAHFSQLRSNPAPGKASYKNCTIRYTESDDGMDRRSFSGRVLIHLHADLRTGEKYYKRFDNAYIYCDSAEIFVRDEGKFVYRIFSQGGVLYLDDSPSWSPSVGQTVYLPESDRYSSGGAPLHRYTIGRPLTEQTGGGHGIGAVDNP